MHFGGRYHQLLSNAYKLKQGRSTLKALLNAVGKELDRIKLRAEKLRDSVFPDLVSGHALDQIGEYLEFRRLPGMPDHLYKGVLKHAHHLQLTMGTVQSIRALCKAMGLKLASVVPNLAHEKDFRGQSRWAEFMIVLKADSRFKEEDAGIAWIQSFIEQVKYIKPVWTRFEIQFVGDTDKSIRKWLATWQWKTYKDLNKKIKDSDEAIEKYLSLVNFHYQDFTVGVENVSFHSDQVRRHIGISFTDEEE